MLPLTVLSRRLEPPSPSVPSTRRRVARVVVIGTSVVIRPLVVRISTSALICSGTSSLMLPFTVSKVASPSQAVSPNEALIDPLTVVALAPCEVDSRTLPLTVYARTSAVRSSARMAAFTIRPANRTPAGT